MHGAASTARWQAGAAVPTLPAVSKAAIIVLVALGPGSAAGGQELAAFLEAGDRSSPALREAAAAVEARAAERAAAAGGLYPRVEVQGRALRNQYAAETFVPTGPGGQPQLVTIVPADQLDLTVTATWPIVDGARWGELTANGLARDAARAEFARRRLDVQRAIVQAFFDHAGAQETRTAAGQALDSAAEFVRQARLRLEAGAGAPLDVARALTDEADRRQSVAEAGRAVSIAAARLEATSGLPVDRTAPMPDLLLSPPGAMPVDAVERHPELAAAQMAMLAAEARVDASRAAWLPTLAVTASELVTNYAGFTGKRATFSAGVVANGSLDPALWRMTAVRSAEKASAAAMVELARRRVRERLVADRASADSAMVALEAATARADAAALTARLVLERFDAGSVTSFEVVSARRDHFLARAAMASARAALGAAHASVRLSAGLEALPGAGP